MLALMKQVVTLRKYTWQGRETNLWPTTVRDLRMASNPQPARNWGFWSKRLKEIEFC